MDPHLAAAGFALCLGGPRMAAAAQRRTSAAAKSFGLAKAADAPGGDLLVGTRTGWKWTGRATFLIL